MRQDYSGQQFAQADASPELDGGIENSPVMDMGAEMSSLQDYYEGALYDIARQGRGVPAVPLVLVGVLP